MSSYENSVGKGWRPIVAKAIAEIEAKGGTILQVKEKFGGLRLYCQGPDEVHEIANTAEFKCMGVCENCGAPGKARDVDWIKTLCDNCPRVEW